MYFLYQLFYKGFENKALTINFEIYKGFENKALTINFEIYQISRPEIILRKVWDFWPKIMIHLTI